jgi:hypothetical protein
LDAGSPAPRITGRAPKLTARHLMAKALLEIVAETVIQA